MPKTKYYRRHRKIKKSPIERNLKINNTESSKLENEEDNMKMFVQDIEPELIEYLESYNTNINDLMEESSYSYQDTIDENNNINNTNSSNTTQ